VKRVLVVGPGPLRPGVGPAVSGIAAELAEALAERGCEVVGVDSSPASALLWSPGPIRRYLEPIDPGTLERIANVERVDATVAHAAGPFVLRALTVEGVGGSWADASPSQLVAATSVLPVDADGPVVDVVAASDGEATEVLAALPCASPAHVALADAEHDVTVEIPRAVMDVVKAFFASRREVGLTTLRLSERGGAFEVFSVDRIDGTLWHVAGLARGVRSGALLGALVAGVPGGEALRKASCRARAVTRRTPSFDFEPYPGVDRTLGARPKSLGATLTTDERTSSARAGAGAGDTDVIVGPGPVRAGHGAEASVATLLAAREAARLGHVVTVVSAREGTDADSAAEIPEGAAHVFLGFGAEPARIAELASRGSDVGARYVARARELEGPPPPPNAVELHVVVLADGTRGKVVGTFEHVERAQVHAEDAAAVFPSLAVDEASLFAAEERAVSLASELGVKGIYTARFAVTGGSAVLSSVAAGVTTHALSLGLILGTDLVADAVRVALGAPVDMRPTALPRHVAVEEHVFPFAALGASDTRLDRRPRSTGSVLALGETVARAYARALAAMGVSLRRPGPGGERAILLAGAEAHAADLADVGRRLYALGFELVATDEAAGWLARTRVPHVRSGDPAGLVSRRGVVAIVATSDRDADLRRAALVAGVTCFTTVELVKVAAKALELDDAAIREVRALEDWAAER
jgi:hypothetical protein